MTIAQLPAARPAAPPRNMEAAEIAAAEMLTALGIDLSEDALAATPGRMARALAEMLTPSEFTLTTFPNDQRYHHLVIERAIRFRSLCEHHLLPFVGHAHIAYLPGKRILGLSKLARVVELHAHRPQVQERLTQQIADYLEKELDCRGVGVVLDAEHMCMSARGVRADGATTVTMALLGALRDDPALRAEFMTFTTTPGAVPR
ncbi:GTP cyclohydrolase I FolE [Microtetraspora malaysiensis]|uniref:GTP cyclohydrolase 1 n=1 Tax=Microtetraspora malaysiensis TaxID=161358 RepID=A0ABW6SMW2_9ACTN